MPDLIPELVIREISALGVSGRALTDIISFSMADDMYEPGGGTLQYAQYGEFADALVEKARFQVQLDNDTVVHIYLQDSKQIVVSEDDRSTLVIEWSFNTMMQRFAEVIVYPGTTGLADDRFWYNNTAGQILRDLLFEAQARGAIPEIGWSFQNLTDSNNAAYLVTIPEFNAKPGSTLLSVLRSLREKYGGIEPRMRKSILSIYNVGTLGTDHTVTQPRLTLKIGEDLISGDRTEYNLNKINRTMAIGDGGRFVVQDNTTSITADPYGPREGVVNVGGIMSINALTQVANKHSLIHGVPKSSRTYTVMMGNNRDPYETYEPGDWVYVMDNEGEPKRMRVRRIALSMDQDGYLTAALAMNDWMNERELLLDLIIEGITGAAAGGTGGDSPLPGRDRIAPAAPVWDPTNVTTALEIPTNGPNRAKFTIPYSAVTTDADGQPIKDLAGYRIDYRQKGTAQHGWRRENGDANDLSITIHDLVPFTTYEIKVRALDTSGNVSADPVPVEKTTAFDHGGFKTVDFTTGETLMNTRGGSRVVAPRRFTIGEIPGGNGLRGLGVAALANGIELDEETGLRCWNPSGGLTIWVNAANGDVTIGGNLSVTGTTTLGGNLALNANLNAAGYTITGGRLQTPSGMIIGGLGLIDIQFAVGYTIGVLSGNLVYASPTGFGHTFNGSGIFVAGSMRSAGAFGCNNALVAGKQTLNAPAVDLPTVIALTNQIRALCVTFGFANP